MASTERVLFLDDDAAFLDGLRRTLRTLGASWDTTFHTDPDDVRTVLATASDAVLVCDWHMPGLDGPGLCEELRALERECERPRTYVILMTGDGTAERLVEGLDRGADDFVHKPIGPLELTARIRVGLRTVTLERSMRETQAELARLARTDALTGLLTRGAGEGVLREEALRVERGLQGVSLFLIDVDHFKQINDQHGHAVGDRVLVAVAGRLRRACRPYDSVVRWGGEEFLVICPNPHVEHTGRMAERLLLAVDHPVQIDRQTALAVTASVGAVEVPEGTLSPSHRWVEQADRALYDAKGAGRNCVRLRPLEEPDGV